MHTTSQYAQLLSKRVCKFLLLFLLSSILIACGSEKKRGNKMTIYREDEKLKTEQDEELLINKTTKKTPPPHVLAKSIIGKYDWSARWKNISSFTITIENKGVGELECAFNMPVCEYLPFEKAGRTDTIKIPPRSSKEIYGKVAGHQGILMLKVKSSFILKFDYYLEYLPNT